jgi:hypothetical protein
MTIDVDSAAHMLRVARVLADALHAYARARRPEDLSAIARLQSELCATRSGELRPAMEQPLIQERAL